jgi:hypothetical protein
MCLVFTPLLLLLLLLLLFSGTGSDTVVVEGTYAILQCTVSPSGGCSVEGEEQDRQEEKTEKETAEAMIVTDRYHPVGLGN